MEVIEFFRKGSEKPEIFACGECGRHWPSGPNADGLSFAEKCCTKGVCERCGDATLPTGWYKCSGCIELDAFDSAEKIQDKDYSGPLELNGTYYRGVDEFCCDHEGDEERPEYAWACDIIVGLSYDPFNIIESLTEEFEDGFEVEGDSEIFEFFEEWNKNQKQEYWMPTKKVVLLDWSYLEELDGKT